MPDTISSESIKSGTSAMGYYESKDSSMPLDVVSMLATSSHLQLNALALELILGVVCRKTGLAISVKILHGS